MKTWMIGCIIIGIAMTILGIPTMVEIAGAAESQVIELKYAGLLPPGQTMSAPVDEWAKEVEKRTQGKIKVTLFHSQTLGKFLDYPKLVLGGLCEMAFIGAITPGFELLGAGELPYSFPSMRVNMDVLHAIYRKGLLSSVFEEKGFKPIFFMTSDPRVFWFVDRKITKLSDMKGMKIRGTTPVHLEIVKALGATPVWISPADIYMALERKTVDGILNQTTGAFGLKMVETMKYCMWEPITSDFAGVIMGLKVWNNLPTDVRTVIQDINEEMRYRYVSYYKTVAEYQEMIRKAGIEVYEIDPQEKAAFRSSLESVTQKWIQDMGKKGLPAKKIVDETNALVKEY